MVVSPGMAQPAVGPQTMLAAALTIGQALLYGGILLVCLMVGGGAIHVLRKRLKDPTDTASGPALTMTQLREMRARGEVTDKEYEALKRVVVSHYETASRPAKRSGD